MHRLGAQEVLHPVLIYHCKGTAPKRAILKLFEGSGCDEHALLVVSVHPAGTLQVSCNMPSCLRNAFCVQSNLEAFCEHVVYTQEVMQASLPHLQVKSESCTGAHML